MTTAISPPIPTFCASASAGRCRKSTPCLSKRLTDRWTRCSPSRNSLFAETDCDRRPDAARAKLAQAGGHPADPVADRRLGRDHRQPRSEEHASELQSLMRISYAVFCLKKKKTNTHPNTVYKQ